MSGSSSLAENNRLLSEIAEKFNLLSTDNLIRYFFVLLACLSCFILIVKHYSQGITIGNNNIFIWLLGLAVTLGPCILISISLRYQTEVSWGRGYLPASVSAWGICLCVAIVLDRLLSKQDRIMNVIMYIMIATILIPNQMVGDIGIKKKGEMFSNTDNLFREASKLGMFSEWQEDITIVDNERIYRDPISHYSYLLGYRTNVVLISSLYSLDEGQMKSTEECYKLNQVGGFSLFSATEDGRCFYTIDADRVCIENGGVIIYGKDMKVFISDNNYSLVEITSTDGKKREIKISDNMLLQESDIGKLYMIDISGEIDCQQIKIRERPCLPFVRRFLEEIGKTFDNQMLTQLSDGISQSDSDAINSLWKYVEGSDKISIEKMSNDHYVVFLYNLILGRDEPNPEGWDSTIDNGTFTKKDLFTIL